MLLLAFGTRPEFLKIKPLINVFNKNGIEYKLLFTGQHEDLLNNVKVDQHIKISDLGNRLDNIINSIMNVINWNGIDYVIVQGDTTSVLAVALSAFHNKIPVIHLEAGLRTFDKQNPYPEETNRRIVSAIADYHLCPTESSLTNLLIEKIEGRMSVVGNTALDNLIEWKNKCEYTNDILITLHRRENHNQMQEWFKEINSLAKKYSKLNFIFPIHPNPNVKKHKHLLKEKNIKTLNPLEHNVLLSILVNTRLVITDSGGIQEECSFFNKICLTCRKVTERPEAIGQSTFLVKNPLELSILFDIFVNNYEINHISPFGDGNSANKIVETLKTWKIV